MFLDAVTVGQGASDYVTGFVTGDDKNGMKRAMWRELVSRVPIAGQIGASREAAVDFLAGERGD